MKKWLAVLLAVVMMMSLAACGEKEKEEIELNEIIDTAFDDVKVDAEEKEIEEIPDEKEAVITEEPEEESNDTEASESDDTSSSDDAEWRQFIKDYEAWVDEYIELLEKYTDDPTDMSILADYTEMLGEMAEWTEKADELELELEDTDEALEFSTELLRIAEKLSKAAY